MRILIKYALIPVLVVILIISCATLPKSFIDLTNDLRSSDRNKRHSAAVSLWEFGDKAIPSLSGAIFDQDEKVQYAAIHSLAGIGTPEAKSALNRVVPILKKDLTHNNSNKRQRAFELLSTIGTPEAMNALGN